MNPLTFLTTTQRLLSGAGLPTLILSAAPGQDAQDLNDRNAVQDVQVRVPAPTPEVRTWTGKPVTGPRMRNVDDLTLRHAPGAARTSQRTSRLLRPDLVLTGVGDVSCGAGPGTLHLDVRMDEQSETLPLASFVPPEAATVSRVVGPADAPITLPTLRQAPGLFVNLAHPLITRALGLPDLYGSSGKFRHGQFSDGRVLPVRQPRRTRDTDALDLPVLTTLLGWVNAYAPQDLVGATLYALGTAVGFAPVPGPRQGRSGLYADHQYVVALSESQVLVADLTAVGATAEEMRAR